ncbi:TlpA family protein disulfide reductase [Fulvivirgaceae bacterium PWU4]|uniref:TlpA family protein disulfide reductase n=1 Tax=Chryseosolibacter histidini TaxID=2782349 RepID=A0AAP2DNR2_9BACT|nr:TlpA disulfide reductase family protein [Chryseosolibacter histidini]MBT1697454.1 TlpA family protein disulfide reductase [Chryseosolibacter histidini]
MILEVQKKRKFLIYILTIALLMGCKEKRDTLLREGVWRGEFLFHEEKVPFLFEVSRELSGPLNIDFINGTEHARYTGVTIERDSIVIPLDLYDSYLIGLSDGQFLKGYYRRNNSPARAIPFEASYGKTHRFEVTGDKTSVDLSGSWDVAITNESDTSADHTVGLFEQRNGQLTGTIMTITGDYRYLAGEVDKNQILLSGFSGSSPRLIKATLIDENNFEGELIGFTSRSKLTGKRNSAAKLPDAYKLTYLKDSVQKFNFTFPDLNGKPVSLTDGKYRDKVVIVTILGSWCPNCIDETAFLASWYKENSDRGVEIIGLAFERKDDLAFAKERLGTLISRFDVKYDILFAGKADKKVASEKLPQLNAVLSFPTTILIDKKGKVRKIHTGFTGPATGKYYESFKEEFADEITNLLNEAGSI